MRNFTKGNMRNFKSEKGSVVLEFTLIYGLLLSLILTIIHFGLLYHTSLSVSDAADAGLEALQANSSASLEDAIKDVIGDAPLIEDLEFSSRTEENFVVVIVSASSPGLVPGLPNRVSRQAYGSMELFSLESDS